MVKTLAYSSRDQGKSAFLDRTSVENNRETGRTLPVAGLYLRLLPVCQRVSLIYYFALNFLGACTFWDIWRGSYFLWPSSHLSTPASAAPDTEEEVCLVNSARYSLIP